MQNDSVSQCVQKGECTLELSNKNLNQIIYKCLTVIQEISPKKKKKQNKCSHKTLISSAK